MAMRRVDYWIRARERVPLEDFQTVVLEETGSRSSDALSA